MEGYKTHNHCEKFFTYLFLVTKMKDQQERNQGNIKDHIANVFSKRSGEKFLTATVRG